MKKTLPLLGVLGFLGVVGGLGCKKEPAAQKPAGLLGVPGTASAPPAIKAAEEAPPVHPLAQPSAPKAEAAAETVPAAPDPKATITGTIFIPAKFKKNINRSGVIFIVARRAPVGEAPGMMLAVQKHPVGDFPMPFALSARDAMVPGTPFDGEMNITVRLDSDGDGLTRRKGDLFGAANGIKVGTQNVTLNVDGLQAEDTTLGGAPAPGSGPPRGMPPGHP